MGRANSATGQIRRGVAAAAASRRSRHAADTPVLLAYRAAEQRLVRVDVPFWFLKMKGPAVQYSLRGTGVDLERLGVTAAELEGYGASVVLDESRHNGDRVLVWTE